MGSVAVSRRQWLRLVRSWWGFESWTTADRRSASFSRHHLRCENHATPQAMASSAPDHPAVPTRDLGKIRYDDDDDEDAAAADDDDIGCGWIGTFSWAHPFLSIYSSPSGISLKCPIVSQNELNWIISHSVMCSYVKSAERNLRQVLKRTILLHLVSL